MRKYIIGIVLISLIGSPFISHAQSNEDSAINIFKELCTKYKNADHLSFRLHYSYRNEINQRPLDSLMGNVMINKNDYHVQLGNTEIIHNSNYNIMLFKDDSLMYLTKSDSVKTVSNPVSLIDTMLLKIKGLNIFLSKNQWNQLITINFPAGMDYKQIIFFIDTKTGYLTKTKYVLKASLIENNNHTALGTSKGLNEWVIVETILNHYQNNTFGDNEFDDKKYFTKEEGGYRTTSAYKGYKIFEGGTNL
jgi:hypothetical protein